MAAWVSREVWQDGSRKREKLAPGIKQDKGIKPIKDADRFVVCWYTPAGRLRQEKIKVPGKPGKHLADERAKALTGDLVKGQYEDKSRKKWADFRAWFEEYFVDEMRPGTQKLYRNSLDAFEQICRPAIMDEIDDDMMLRFRRALRKRKGIKGNTLTPLGVNKHLRILGVALRRAARKRKWLKEMPEIIFLKPPKANPVYITPTQFDAIYTACDVAAEPADVPFPASEWWRALIVTGLMCGCRIDEMLTLSWEDVHLDEGWLLIRAEKSKANRDDTIPLHPVVIDHLRAITTDGPAPFDWPISESSLYRQWHRIQAAAGIDLGCNEPHKHTERCGKFGFHALKKSCGTLQAAAGIPESVLAAFMRHRNPQTTREFYQNKQHLAASHLDKMFLPDSLRKPK